MWYHGPIASGRPAHTAEGKELAGALRLLAQWGARHALPAEAPRHQACGTPLEARWYCPTCDHLVEDEPELEMQFLMVGNLSRQSDVAPAGLFGLGPGPGLSSDLAGRNCGARRE